MIMDFATDYALSEVKLTLTLTRTLTLTLTPV